LPAAGWVLMSPLGTHCWMGTDEPFRDPAEKRSRGNPFAKRVGTSYSECGGLLYEVPVLFV